MTHVSNHTSNHSTTNGAPPSDADGTHHLHLPRMTRREDGRVEVSMRLRDFQDLVSAFGLEALYAGPPAGEGGHGARALALMRVLVTALPADAQDEVREMCRMRRRSRRSA